MVPRHRFKKKIKILFYHLYIDKNVFCIRLEKRTWTLGGGPAT